MISMCVQILQSLIVGINLYYVHFTFIYFAMIPTQDMINKHKCNVGGLLHFALLLQTTQTELCS